MNISDAKRIIIKVGSSLLVNEKDKKLDEAWLKALCEDIAKLHKQGKEVIIVSSGAVALGRTAIGKLDQPLKLEEKQAAAACGQTALVEHYQKKLNKYKINAAQILLTIRDSENRRRYLNARNAIETLLKHGIIPIINENDSVATNELRFGDNDRLAARVAQMTSSDLLILLSDIDGLFTSNPKINANASHIKRVETIDDSVRGMAGGATSNTGSGGMVTKIMAADIALQNGCNMIITNGQKKHPIARLLKGDKHTLFTAKDSPLSAKKNWIMSSLDVKGKILIDKGAEKALAKGNSLLPAGVITIKGEFKRGDAVSVLNSKSQEIGRGLTAYSAKNAKIIAGHQSHDIENLIGFSGRNELIHRDDLVMIEESK